MPIKKARSKKFEGDMRIIVTHDFSDALITLKEGGQARRTGWNGVGMFIEIQYPDSGSANTLPYIWISTAQGGRVPWVASQTDLLSNDWVDLDEEK